MAKSILSHHRTIDLSPTMRVEEYSYVYIKGFDAHRANECHKSERHIGWESVAVDREDLRAKQGGLWIIREVWQKKKKRAKKEK